MKLQKAMKRFMSQTMEKNDANTNKTNDTQKELGECECSDMDVSNGTNKSSDSPLFS